MKKLAYLVNQYPMASLTFIRREIIELERLGYSVERFAIQPWGDRLVDENDVRERNKTHYLKRWIPLLCSTFLTCARQPIQFIAAIRLASRIARRSDRSWIHHFAYLAEACHLKRLLSKYSIEHLHIHFATNSTEVGFLCSVLGGPAYSFTVHGPEEFDRAAYQSLDLKASRASFVFPISSFGRSQLMRWIPSSDWSKIQVVHCGLDDSYLSKTHEPLSDSKRLVCIGRLCEQKGQLLLVEAFAKLIKSGTTAQLVLVGDGPMRQEIESLIAKHGIGDYVRITGWASGETVQKELADARVMVLPSFAEGLPVVIMEALAMERPVISTYIAGIPELVEPGSNGWLVPAGDVESLVDAMRAALETPVERLREMGKAGRERVLERHNIKTEVAKLARSMEHGAWSMERGAGSGE